MSGLQNFLTPYSHLIFANRNVVIVLLAGVLGWTVIQLLVARWRTERLQRDLIAARSTQSTAPVRGRHMPPQLAEEAPAESGGLPPIKGGRSYARNLGSALQKAGIPAAIPQIYSPPVPAGWNPNTNPNPPASMPAPMQPPTYAPPSAPWGAPQSQPQTPWAYPAGANRPPLGPQPNAPMPGQYSPFPAAGGPAPAAAQPFAAQPFPQPFPQPPQGPFAQPYAPTSAPAEYGRQNMDAAPLASSAPAPVAPTQLPPAPTQPTTPPFGVPAPTPDMSGEGNGQDSGRRGKPKRRRFNLSVLDNLEKMVQSKTAEPPSQPSTPVAADFAATAAAAPATPALAAAAVEPVVAAPTLFDPVPAAEPEPAVVEAPREDAATEAYSEPVQAEHEPAPVEAEVPSAPEQTARTRPDMHSMLFGEEPEAAEQPSDQPVAEEPVSVEEAPAYAPVVSTPSWSEPEPVAQAEPVIEAEPVAQVEPVAEVQPTVEAEPVAELPAVETVEVAEEAPQPEPVQAEAEPEPQVEAPAEGSHEAASGGGDAGVLVIIEDDQTAAEYYATLFRGNGYNVNVANDGISGVDLCVRVQPQVILLDVMMPRQNGILVLQTLRASDETRNTPVVVMSNFSEPTLIKRALQLGALEYVIKTQVEGAALLAAVPRWMNREKAFAA